MKKTLIAAGASLTLLLGACNNTPDKADFRKETEKFIVKDGGDVEKETGQKFTAATCEEPASTAVGTQFSCVATGADGKSYKFGVEIDKKNAFLVKTVTATDDTVTTGGTITTDEAPTTTAA